MIKKHGLNYTKEQIDEEILLSKCKNCKCNQLFTSNRQEGCVTVQDFLIKDFIDNHLRLVLNFYIIKNSEENSHP